MIDHLQNGYLAEARNAADLAEGIRFVLEKADADALSSNAVRTAHARYGEDHVAAKYIAIYRHATEFK